MMKGLFSPRTLNQESLIGTAPKMVLSHGPTKLLLDNRTGAK